jgi:ATP-dependent RNA helicase DeaD
MEETLFTYKDLNLSTPVQKAIDEKGYIIPTPIQKEIIPLFIKWERDIIGQASTGTGKTAAFGIPLIELIQSDLPGTEALIMCPTRELAIQVAEEIKSLSKYKPLNITLLYGGNKYYLEEKGLRSQPKIIVGTPGRIKDHLDRGNLKIGTIKYFVLDEADEMLNIGFREAIDEIMKLTPPDKRVLLFSATMPKEILRIAERYMRKYDLISIKRDDSKKALIAQSYFTVNERNKFDLLSMIIESSPDFYGIVFCKRKIDVDEVNEKLRAVGYKSEGIHSDFEQKNRERILKRFKDGDTKILVATDVAARGIDVSDLNYVINYGFPENAETYTHRIGRTGRAWKEGNAITFVTRIEERKMFFIERDLKVPIKKGKIPTKEEVLEIKKQKFIATLEKEIEKDIPQPYHDMAKQVSALSNKEGVISHLLYKLMGSTFFEVKDLGVKSEFNLGQSSGWERFERRESSSSFGRNERSERSERPERKSFGERTERFERRDSSSRDDIEDGFQRLFVAKWRMHGVETPVEILRMIEKDTGVALKRECKIDIFSEFTFVNVREQDARKILTTYKDLNRDKPLVVQAKRKDR